MTDATPSRSPLDLLWEMEKRLRSLAYEFIEDGNINAAQCIHEELSDNFPALREAIEGERERTIGGRRLEWGLSERQDAVNVLRQVCVDHGDNDWSDSLHLGDAIEKHLWRYLENNPIQDGQSGGKGEDKDG